MNERSALKTVLGGSFGKGGPPLWRSSGGPRRPVLKVLVLVLAALPLLLGAIACVALTVQTIREVLAARAASGLADWILVLAAAFFLVMVVALISAAVMLLRRRPPWWPSWVGTLIIGLGGAVLGFQQLSEASWRVTSNAGLGPVVFILLSVYLVGVSGVCLVTHSSGAEERDVSDEA